MRDLTHGEEEFLLTVLEAMEKAVVTTYSRPLKKGDKVDPTVDPDEALYKVLNLVSLLKKNPQDLKRAGVIELQLILQVIERGIPEDLPPKEWKEELHPDVFSLITLISEEVLRDSQIGPISLN